MTTVTDIKLLIDDIADIKSGDFPNIKKTRMMNSNQDKIVNIIMENDRLQQWDDEGWGDLNEGFLDLVNGQVDYNLDEDENFSDILFISKIWILETEDSIEYVEINRDGKFTSEITEGTPRRWRQVGKKILLDPIPSYNKTDGMKVSFVRAPKPILTTDTTRKLGFPSTFDRLLALYTAYDWARAKTLSNRNDILAEVVTEERRLGIFVGRQGGETADVLEAPTINSV